MTRAEAVRLVLIALGGALLSPLWLPALVWVVVVLAVAMGAGS